MLQYNVLGVGWAAYAIHCAQRTYRVVAEQKALFSETRLEKSAARKTARTVIQRVTVFEGDFFA